MTAKSSSTRPTRWARTGSGSGSSPDEHHRQPRWVLFLSGEEKAKPTTAQLIADVGFEPVDLGDIDDSRLQELGSALWGTTLEADEAEALAMRVRANGAAADPLTAPFEKLRDHAPDDPAFFFDHLSRAVFQAGHQSAATAALAGMAPLVDTGRQLGVVICGSGESRQDEHQRIARRAGQKRW